MASADYSNVGMGLGVMGNDNSETGPSESVTAEFSPAVLFKGGEYHEENCNGKYRDCDYFFPIVMGSGNLRYNVVGSNYFGDLVTNVQADAQVGVGGTPAHADDGLDLYGMVVGDFGVGAFYHEDASNTARGSVTAETGIRYATAESVLMLSPAVGLGSVSHYALKDGGKMLTDSDALRIGGRARWIIDDKLWLSAEGFYSPSLNEYADDEKKRSWDTTQGALDLRYTLSDKWSVHGTIRHTSYQGVTPMSNDLSETSGVVTLLRELL